MIQNGVDPGDPLDPQERATARAALGLSEAEVAAIYLGSLDAHKDPLTAARAAVEAGPPLVLLVAGDGPLRPELERLELESGSVRVLGHRPDVRAVLAAADLFVLPSLREGLSFAVLEAMALGLPPVVSDAPGNPEAVGDAGVVVARGDTHGFAAAFRALLDGPGRRALGERARDRVARGFTAKQMVGRTRELYDEVLA